MLLYAGLLSLALLQYAFAQVCIAPTTTATTTTTTATPTCPTGWKTFGSNCYMIDPTPVNTPTAIQMCKASGAHLVSVHSAAEVTFVQNMIAAAGPLVTTAWTALARIGTGTADFAYIDGTPFNYPIWHVGEPSLINPAGLLPEYCVTIATDGTMNDLNCSFMEPFICEKSI